MLIKRMSKALALMFLLPVILLGQGDRWEILRAEYGAGGNWRDVTSRVRSLVRGDALSLRVTNDTLGGDPAPGSPKTLRLRLRDDSGHVTVLTFAEKDSVTLAIRTGGASWGSLQITHAEYGANRHLLDVTDLLNSRVQGNRLTMSVTNETMGGDPAHDAHKLLTVWYTYNGFDGQVTVREHDTLNLPGNTAQLAGLRIVRAEYGADNRFANVTSRLAARVQGNRLTMPVTNETMGGDPAEDRQKLLTVWYTYNGKMADADVREGDQLDLPGYGESYYGNSLRILRAQYGAGYRHADVTERLNSRIQGDQLNLRVTNDTMGGDPADDQRKRLTVLYLYNGRQYRAEVGEGDYLNLPDSGEWLGENTAAGDLQILRATYGVGDRRMDVTDRVGSQVNGGQLNLRVSDSTMGGDPAHGQKKRLEVIYLSQGFRYRITVGEGETLTLP